MTWSSKFDHSSAAMEARVAAVEKDLNDRATALAAEKNGRITNLQAVLKEERQRRKQLELKLEMKMERRSLEEELEKATEAQEALQEELTKTKAELNKAR